ncbi:hypothetical protein GCM10022410_13160 [Amphibacillus indicireducens]|uniref:Uncharacterized protein n=1 Tax=Amphibacillus indicireducens TaxID=1076330 RepID=A0ABP7VJH4_9BACI
MSASAVKIAISIKNNVLFDCIVKIPPCFLDFAFNRVQKEDKMGQDFRGSAALSSTMYVFKYMSN